VGHCREGRWQRMVQGGGSWGLHREQSEGQGGGGGMVAVQGGGEEVQGDASQAAAGPWRQVAVSITWSCCLTTSTVHHVNLM
jgi:hypothetical protein